MDKLKDLLKQVDKDTRRCIVFLNNKMDEQFKRLMTVKTPPAPPQPIDVTELRAELRRDIDEIKSYVKSRDKVNKDAIKKMEERIESILSSVTVKKDNLKSTYKPFKEEFSAPLVMEMSEKELKAYLEPHLDNAVTWAVEVEILALADGNVTFHPNFMDTIRTIHSNDLRWLEYITLLNSIPRKFPPEFSSDRSIELFRISYTLVDEHMKDYGIVMKPLRVFCVKDAVTALLLWCVTENFSHPIPTDEELIIMGQNRKHWLPFNCAELQTSILEM